MFIKRQTTPSVLCLCIMSFANSKKLFAKLLFKNDSTKLKKNDRYSNKHVFGYIYIYILLYYTIQMNQFFTILITYHHIVFFMLTLQIS